MTEKKRPKTINEKLKMEINASPEAIFSYFC